MTLWRDFPRREGSASDMSFPSFADLAMDWRILRVETYWIRKMTNGLFEART